MWTLGYITGIAIGAVISCFVIYFTIKRAFKNIEKGKW